MTSAPAAPKLHNREAIERISFLYQAAHSALAVPPLGGPPHAPSAAVPPAKRSATGRRRQRRQRQRPRPRPQAAPHPSATSSSSSSGSGGSGSGSGSGSCDFAQAQAPDAAPAPSPSTVVNARLARHYLKTAKGITKRLVMRLDPSLKRTICKRCGGLLVPGLTSAVTVANGSRFPSVSYACGLCGFARSFVGDPEHVLYTDKEGIDTTLAFSAKPV